MRNLDKTQGRDYISIGANVSGVIKNNSGSILALACTNLNNAIRYIQFFNAIAVPTGGATPFFVYPVYNTSGMVYFDERYFGPDGRYFNVGITFGFSTTPLTYTAAAAADVILEVRYS